MKIISVAVGTQYEIEVERLKAHIGQDVEVFTKDDILYSKINDDSLIDGLYHKTNFANYLQDIETTLIFCDADMFNFKTNPLETFQVKETTDVAFVKYPGQYFFPDTIRQTTFEFFGYKVNSGFMYFKNLQVAKAICTEWSKQYLERVKLYDANTPSVTKFEYDEYALMIALKNLNYNIEVLDKKWNDFELITEDEMKSSDSIFFQSHDLSIGK